MDSSNIDNKNDIETIQKEDEKFEDPLESFDGNNKDNEDNDFSKEDKEPKENENKEENHIKKEIIQVKIFKTISLK